MNEYTQVRNAHDRAVILAQLVNADARALVGRLHPPIRMGGAPQAISLDAPFDEAWSNYRQSRAELWKLIGPAPEGEPAEVEEPKRKLQPWDPR